MKRVNKTSKSIKKKPKKIKKIDLNAIKVPLSNKFSVLEDDIDADTVNESPNKSKSNVAPVVITNHDINIEEVLKSLQAPFHLKLVSVGRKIFTNNAEDKSKLEKALKEKNIPFFSHPDDAHKVFKVVL